MGPALGMFVWGPVTQVLLDSVGWRNTFRVMALSCSLIFLFAITFNSNIEEKDKISEENPNQENTEQNNEDDDGNSESAKVQIRKEELKIIDFSVWRIPQYCILVVSFTLMSMCRFVPNVHLVSENITLSSAAKSWPKIHLYKLYTP